MRGAGSSQTCVHQVSITAPSKPIQPSKQTQLLLDQMSQSKNDDQSRWDQLLDNFNLLFNRMTDMGITQQELKTQIELSNAKVDQCAKDQQFISKQVQANGQAVAQLTMRQFEEDNKSAGSQSESLESDDETPSFQNVFSKSKMSYKAEPHKYQKPKLESQRIDSVPHHTLSKMYFPKFDGNHPRI